MKNIIEKVFGYVPSKRELKESSIGAVCCIGMCALMGLVMYVFN